MPEKKQEGIQGPTGKSDHRRAWITGVIVVPVVVALIGLIPFACDQWKKGPSDGPTPTPSGVRTTSKANGYITSHTNEQEVAGKRHTVTIRADEPPPGSQWFIISEPDNNKGAFFPYGASASGAGTFTAELQIGPSLTSYTIRLMLVSPAGVGEIKAARTRSGYNVEGMSKEPDGQPVVHLVRLRLTSFPTS